MADDNTLDQPVEESHKKERSESDQSSRDGDDDEELDPRIQVKEDVVMLWEKTKGECLWFRKI